MKKVQKEHPEENIALLVDGVLNDFFIKNCIRYFIMDNATTNNRFMRVLAQKF